jgi:hypothetical protein
MRRPGVLLALIAGVAAGCGGDDGGGPVDLAVTTPPASATVAASPPATPAATPAATPTAVPGTGTAPPPVEDPGGTGAAGPAAAYAALVRQWQAARSAFFAEVSGGRPLTVAQQRALAAEFLAAQRTFGTALRTYPWPVGARPPVSRLRAENAVQQRFLAGMAKAATKAEFAGGLASYGVGTAAENAAVAAVTVALV